MQEVVTILTTPSNISGDLQAPMGGSAFIVGDADFLGARFELQVSRDGGSNYISAGEFTRPCALTIPWGSTRARFVCLAGPSGPLAAPVAICSLRT